VRLTRAEQDGILTECLVFAQIVGNGHRCPQGHRLRYRPTTSHDEASLRASLRLDDPVLDDLIDRAKISGQPIQWSENRNREQPCSRSLTRLR